ncbi:MAG: hypothetical protein ACAH80_00160 [Alphaproteobacteria bacterium]
MPKKSTASTADIFLNAASQRVSDKERERLKQEAADKKEALRQQKEEARELKALRKAFPEYYAMVEPLLKAMESLPASGGDEFFVRADLHLDEHYKTKVPTKSMHIWVLYTHEQKTPYGQGEAPNTHSLAIDRKGTPKGDRDDVDLALNGNKVLKLELDTDENGKIKISSHAYEEYYSYVPPYRRAGYYSSSSRGHYESRSATTTAVTHDSISGFAAALGGWVQDTAPERLPEIAAALGAGDIKIATERMTVNKPIKLKPT